MGKAMSTAAVTGAASARNRPRAALLAFWVLAASATAAAQGPEAPPQFKSLSPIGVRSHLTESWGVLGFALSNPSAEALEARVLTFYARAPGRQYGRDVWVPAQATLRSWFCIAPPPGPPDRNVIELKSLLYDRTGGKEHLLRSPEGQPLHSELVSFSRREPGTALMLDADVIDGSQATPSPRDQARAKEVHDLVRVFRHRRGWSPRVNSVKQRFLPPVSEALDGIDHFVLGSDRIADDAAGRRALREWLQRGGSLWVLLDQVEQGTVAALLGDVLDLQVVDRGSLTSIHVRSGPANPHRAEAQPRDVEEPVDFVRVLAPHQQVLYTVNGWPAAFLTEVGRGRVLFTMLGARGWTRPRTDHDHRPTYQEFPNLPVALEPFEFLADELHPRSERPAFTADDLRSYVTEQISYAVVGHTTVLLVFGLFFLALTAAAVVLGRKGLREHLGWLGPALALGAAGVFVGLGELSRGAVPPSVAVVQLVDAVPGLDEVQTSGFLGIYQPSSDTSPLGAEEGGQLELDVAGLEGRVHRRVQTDLDRWHWENLELPAGVRVAPFRHTLRTAEPVEATVRFGPQGVEGRVAPGPFRQLEDVLLSTPGHHILAVRLRADGSFRSGSDDEPAVGQWIVGGLLSDRQRARQGLYEKLLAEPWPRYLANRSLLLAWAEPVDMHFTLVPQARTTGAALLAIPLQFERTPPGMRVSVPAAFMDCRRVTSDGQALRPAAESRLVTNLRLRFQLPASVLPLDVESARLTLKLHAPAREVVVSALVEGDAVLLRRLTSPLSIETFAIDDPRLLQPDEHGALYMSIEVGEVRGGNTERDLWRLESPSLEVHGRTAGEERDKHEPR
jgi:hypothetical protein